MRRKEHGVDEGDPGMSVRRYVTVGTALATIAVGALLWSPPVSGDTLGGLSDSFESGTLDAWSSAASASVSPDAADHGTFGLEINANQAPGYVGWSPSLVPQGHSYASLRAYVQVVSQGDGESLGLITVRNSLGVHNFDFFVTADTHRFKWDLANSDSAESAFTVEPGRWYLVEIQCEFAGTYYNAGVKIDGVNQGLITSAGQVPATVRSVWLGTYAPKTHVQRYDDVELSVGDSWPGYLGAAAG